MPTKAWTFQTSIGEALVDGIAARPAVARGVAVLADRRRPLTDDKARPAIGQGPAASKA